MAQAPYLEWFTNAVAELEKLVPRPVYVPAADGKRDLKFIQQEVGQAILLKVARYVSSLNAALLLHDAGLLLEVGTIQRSLDEANEDITFLSYAAITGEIEQIHRDYLEAFWEDEPTFQEFLQKPRKRFMPSRDKIQAHIDRCANEGIQDYRSLNTAKYMSRNKSGYVHSAAPHLMLLIHPQTLNLQVEGLTYKPPIAKVLREIENYVFRGVTAIALAAKVLTTASCMKKQWQPKQK